MSRRVGAVGLCAAWIIGCGLDLPWVAPIRAEAILCFVPALALGRLTSLRRQGVAIASGALLLALMVKDADRLGGADATAVRLALLGTLLAGIILALGRAREGERAPEVDASLPRARARARS